MSLKIDLSDHGQTIKKGKSCLKNAGMHTVVKLAMKMTGVSFRGSKFVD